MPVRARGVRSMRSEKRKKKTCDQKQAFDLYLLKIMENFASPLLSLHQKKEKEFLFFTFFLR